MIFVYSLLFIVSQRSKLRPKATPTEPLAKSHSKFLGNIVSASSASGVPASFAKYWNQVTPENGGKWGSVEGSRGNYNWGQADAAYNYAKTNGFKFKYHTLVWGSQEPSWISGLGAADQKAAVTAFIKAVGQRFPQADFVDVVNEALHAPASYRNAIGGDVSSGWDWIVWSFQQARSALPNSKLFINEYGIINDANAARKYVQIITILKQQNLIDGIGIQTHQFNVNDISVSTINSVLDILGATGLSIYPSELDINGNSEADQATIYKRVFPALWENTHVQGITLWGYITGQTWKDGTGILDSNGNERQALKWLVEYFASDASHV
jgi:endo-1,4-beta-xylanase